MEPTSSNASGGTEGQGEWGQYDRDVREMGVCAGGGESSESKGEGKEEEDDQERAWMREEGQFQHMPQQLGMDDNNILEAERQQLRGQMEELQFTAIVAFCSMMTANDCTHVPCSSCFVSKCSLRQMARSQGIAREEEHCF